MFPSLHDPCGPFRLNVTNNGCRMCHKQTILRCPICQITYCSNECRKIDLQHKKLCHDLIFYINSFSQPDNRKICAEIFSYIITQVSNLSLKTGTKRSDKDHNSEVIQNIRKRKFYFKGDKLYVDNKSLKFDIEYQGIFNYNICNSAYGRLVYLLSPNINEGIFSSDAISLLIYMNCGGCSNLFNGKLQNYPEGNFLNENAAICSRNKSLKDVVNNDIKQLKNRVAYMIHFKPNSERSLYHEDCKGITWEGLSGRKHLYTHHILVLRIGGKSCIIQCYSGYYGTKEWLNFDEDLERKEDLRETSMEGWRKELRREVKYRGIMNNEKLLGLMEDIDGMCREKDNDSVYGDITGVVADIGVGSYSVYYIGVDMERI